MAVLAAKSPQAEVAIVSIIKMLFLVLLSSANLKAVVDFDFSYNYLTITGVNTTEAIGSKGFESRFSALYPFFPAFKMGVSYSIGQDLKRDVALPYNLRVNELSTVAQMEVRAARFAFGLYGHYVFAREYFYAFDNEAVKHEMLYGGTQNYGLALFYQLLPPARLLCRADYQKGILLLHPDESVRKQSIIKKSIGVGFEYSL